MKRFGSFVAVLLLAVVVAYSVGRAQEAKTVKHPDRFLGFLSVGDHIILDDNVRGSRESPAVTGYRVRIVSAEYAQNQIDGREKRAAELKALTEELKVLDEKAQQSPKAKPSNEGTNRRTEVSRQISFLRAVERDRYGAGEITAIGTDYIGVRIVDARTSNPTELFIPQTQIAVITRVQ